MSKTDDVIAKLVKGFGQFKVRHFDKTDRYTTLVKQGQSPAVLWIGCCDSRVDPAIVTDSAPGELFVVRNVANLVPPYKVDPRHHGTSAALEYAVRHLNVSHIIVCGHSDCGGIRALVERDEQGGGSACDFISAWMDIAVEAKRKVLARHPDADIPTQARDCEQQSLLVSLNNLNTYPWLQQRIEAGTLTLHAWYFDMPAGELLTYVPASDSFAPLV